MENNLNNNRKKSNRSHRAEANSTLFEPVRHLHDGHVYHLPIPVKSSGIQFSDLQLTFIKVGKFATVSLNSSQHEFIAPLSDDHYQVILTLTGIDRSNADSLARNPVVYIYRKGTPAPLYRCEMSFGRDDYTAMLRQVELGTGDYFMLISGAEEGMSCYCEMEDMEGMATFHFSIKPHGSRLLHPKLRHWLDDDLPLLHLVSTDDGLNVCDEYRYECYNQVYRLIYKHTCTAEERCLTLSLMDLSSPLDDIYTVILYHNNEPIMAYRYTLLEKKVYHLTAMEIKGMSPLMEFMFRMDGTSQTRLNELVMMEEELFVSLDREALGKTTVARIMGKVFKELGILSIGEVITVERADMVGKYIGHTEDTMKELLERSKGNVLFIDEAYSLCDSSRSDRTDYGYRVIECLLGVLAKNDSDMIIIMAGYEEEMKLMLSKNPDLRGRFVYTFNFEDYTSDQLLTICLNKLQEKCFCVDDSAKEVMKSCIVRTVATKDALFHNARWAEQFAMQGIVSAMADRICLANEHPNIQDLCTVTINDVLTGYEISRPSGNSDRRPVGFRNG